MEPKVVLLAKGIKLSDESAIIAPAALTVTSFPLASSSITITPDEMIVVGPDDPVETGVAAERELNI